MLLRHTLLYLPAQFIGPLFQLVAMIVWTHLVNEHTLGVLTLVTATHELLQIGFLAWWSQYALRFFGRYQDADAPRFYRTENAVLLLSVTLQSIAVVGILLLVIAPGAKAGILVASCRLCDHPFAQRLYRRARPGPSPDRGLFDPADFWPVDRLHPRTGLDQAVRPIRRMAAGGLCHRATLRRARRAAEDRLRSPPLADRPRDRRACAALRHSVDCRRCARLGRAQCVAIHRQRDGGCRRRRPVRRRLRPRAARRRGRRNAGDGSRLSTRRENHGARRQPGRDAPARR